MGEYLESLSSKKIADTMTSGRRKIDSRMLENYLFVLCETYIVYKVKRYNIFARALGACYHNYRQRKRIWMRLSRRLLSLEFRKICKWRCPSYNDLLIKELIEKENAASSQS